MDDNKIVTPENFQEELIAALTVGSHLVAKNGHPDSAKLLLQLRESVKKTYRPVWTNGKALRRFQGQDKYIAKNGWRKEHGIFLDEQI